MDKISQLKRDDQVVAGILDRFCQIPQEVGPKLTQLVDLVHELQNSKTSTSAPTTTIKSTALPSTSGMFAIHDLRIFFRIESYDGEILSSKTS